MCKAVQLQLQTIRITIDFVILEPGCADIILGIQWLRTLGKCEMDWEEQEFSFQADNRRITLFGDQNLHGQLGLLQWGEDSERMDVSLQSMSLETGDKDSIPQQIAQVLNSFAEVFVEPTGLPPRRGWEHSIRLREGSETITVRPYRYPQAHMEAIEKMVKEMLATCII